MYKSSDSLVQRCFSRLINAKAVKTCSECSFCPIYVIRHIYFCWVRSPAVSATLSTQFVPSPWAVSGLFYAARPCVAFSARFICSLLCSPGRGGFPFCPWQQISPRPSAAIPIMVRKSGLPEYSSIPHCG